MPEPDIPPVYQLRVVLREDQPPHLAPSPRSWRHQLRRPPRHPPDRLRVGRRAPPPIRGPRRRLRRRRPRSRAGDLGLRQADRFVYDYDLGVLWRHDIRVEQLIAAQPAQRYPRCIGGRRAGPPEECGGPWAYLQGRQRHDIFAVASLLADMLGHPDALLGDYRDQLEELRPWLDLDRFDRRVVNRALAGLAQTERNAV